MQDILDDNFTHSKTPKYAGFWIRLGASLLDGLVLSPVIAFMFYNNFSLKSFPLMIGVSILFQFYKPLMEGIYGYTLGKKMLNLRIVDEANEKISMKQAFVRWIPWAVSAAIGLLASISLFSMEGFEEAEGFMEISLLQQGDFYNTINSFFSIIFIVIAIMVGIDKKKQGLHDKMAETFVVENER